jgi:hypothetical protein
MKGVIAKVTHHNSPLGDEYRVLNLNAELPEYRSTAVENTAVLESKSTGQLKTVLKNKEQSDDDEAFATMCSALKQASLEITGKAPSATEAAKWREVADVLITELKIAAARTTVSSTPSFLAEHLRRRLFKKDSKTMNDEAKAGEMDFPPSAIAVDASKCLECGGTGWFYPDGQEKGVTKCRHEKLVRGE